MAVLDFGLLTPALLRGPDGNKTRQSDVEKCKKIRSTSSNLENTMET